MTRAATGALVVIGIAVVVWIRLVPLSLPVTDTWAGLLAARPQPEAGLEADRATIGRRLKALMSYTGADGRERPYLGDYDSYLWLRHARNYLDTGTPCDAVVRGACRDTYTNAPVGARTTYARSLHVHAIAGLHRLITRFSPGYPLPASAYWVPVVVGALGVMPAFFIAWRLAGAGAAPRAAAVAGAFAVALTALSPIVLSRSIGADNDIWNVVLPLTMMWAIIEAMAADGPRRRSLYAALAGVCASLQAWTWRGWLFSYAVVVIGLAGHAVLCAARHAIERRTLRVWGARELGPTLLVLAIFYVMVGLGSTLAGSEEPYAAIPFKAVGAVFGTRAEGGAWPSALTMVAELSPLRFRGIVSAMGGALVFAGGGLGLALTLRSGGAREAGAILLAVWLLAAIHASYGANRFLLLLAPPLGIACAIAIGRLSGWLSRLADGASVAYRVTLHAVLVAVLALALLYPVRWGYATARGYTPAMHDAWWDTLTHIRDIARPDAIVTAWWDYGHWIKYVADRPVSNDGSSLLTHIPHWIARALLAPTERESVGLLRMLDCASDATPAPEQSQGAYGRLRNAGRDPVSAYGIVADLATLDAPDAEAYLGRHGFTASERVGILRSTHCEPPEGYLILSSDLVLKRGPWTRLGLWDPRRVPAAAPGTAAAPEDAGDELGRRFGSGEGNVTWTGPVPFVPRWLPCRTEASRMICPIRAPTTERTEIPETFIYDPAAPRDGRLESPQRQGRPASIVLARERRMDVLVAGLPAYPELGVLIDLPGQRILVGAPFFLESTFVHLMYLDGRYATHYKKLDDRSDTGERVVTWRIDWSGRSGPSGE